MSKEEWLKENAVTIILWSAGIVIAAFGYLVLTLFGISIQLTRVETNGENTANRVGRIADALPALGVQIAHEEIVKPIEFAIATTMPVQSPDGRWIRSFHFIEPANMKAFTYTVPMASQDDLSLTHSLYGLARTTDPNHASFRELQRWSVVAEEPTTTPGFIDAEHSLVVRRGNPDDYLKMLRSAQSRWVEFELDSEVIDWQSLTEELSSNSEIKEPE